MLEVGRVGRRRRRRPDALDRRIEVPETLAGHSGRDLGTDAEGHDRLVRNQKPARLVHRRQDRLHVQRRHRSEVDHFDGDPLGLHDVGGGERLVDHP